MPINRDAIKNKADVVFKAQEGCILIEFAATPPRKAVFEILHIGDWYGFYASEGERGDLWVYYPISCDPQSLVTEISRFLVEEFKFEVEEI